MGGNKIREFYTLDPSQHIKVRNKENKESDYLATSNFYAFFRAAAFLIRKRKTFQTVDSEIEPEA